MNIVTGDDVEVAVTLTIDGEIFTIGDLASVRVIITDKTGTVALFNPITVTDSGSESDWGNSRIVIRIPGRATDQVKYSMPARLQVKIIDGGFQRTWFSNISLTKGLIF